MITNKKFYIGLAIFESLITVVSFSMCSNETAKSLIGAIGIIAIGCNVFYLLRSG